MTKLNEIVYWVLGWVCLVLSATDEKHSDAFFIASIVLFCSSTIIGEIGKLKDNKK